MHLRYEVVCQHSNREHCPPKHESDDDGKSSRCGALLIPAPHNRKREVYTSRPRIHRRGCLVLLFPYTALLAAFPSSARSLPMLTLICFGLASAFFASLIFNTPLS